MERLAKTWYPPTHFVPAATGIHVTVSCAVHSPICLPSGEQTDSPAVEHVPVDGVEGVVELDEELVIAEGAELGAAAATEGAADAAAEGATEGATDGAAPAGAAEAAIEGAAEEAL